MAAKKPVVKKPRFEYDPMRSSGSTAGGADPQDSVFDRTDLNDEWNSQNSIGDPFDSYSNDILSDKGIDNFLSSDSIQSFNQIQKQMDFIQDVLPNIKDVSERAGIVNKYAPQMEEAMQKLETDLETQENKLIQKSKPLAKKVIQAQKEE